MTHPPSAPPPGTPPGFYPDPADPSVERFWDGMQWTPRTRRIGAITAPQRWVNPPLIAALVALTLMAVGAVLFFTLTTDSGSKGSQTFTASGTFGLGGSVVSDVEPNFGDIAVGADGITCHGANGYEDIDNGTQVLVSDETGKNVAVTELGIGQYIGGECRYILNITDIPGGHQFYKVEVGHRGGIRFTQAQLEDGDLELGIRAN